jgi:hypothetical protein
LHQCSGARFEIAHLTKNIVIAEAFVARTREHGVVGDLVLKAEPTEPTIAKLSRVANLVGDPARPGLFIQMRTWRRGNFSSPHFHPNDRLITVLSGTWWVGTGYEFDPANLSVPMKAGTFVTDLAKGVHGMAQKTKMLRS